MAIYRTNTEELTSIADAIRAKTGSNSSLVYPTGFVNAINGIGTNTPLYSNIITELTLTLADTDFANWDSSVSTSIIYDSVTLDSFRRNMTNKSCLIICYGYVKYAYKTTAPNNSGIWYSVGHIIECSPRENSTTDLMNKAKTYINSWNLLGTVSLMYKNSSGTESSTGNAYGILVSALAISTGSNTNPANFLIVPKTPNIRIITNPSYISADSFSNIDPENTIIYYKLVYEEYPCNLLYNKIYDAMSDMYIQANSN